jgi:4-amino-4-deoxy-L-arabinose transferase-like glycosyltransferase
LRADPTFMTTAAFVRLAYNPVERLYDALVDPARSERVMGVLLVGYAAVWSLYGAVAKGSQDLHYDMGEMYAWSSRLSLGTPKHPPLGAWLVRGWFSLFPATPWAFYLLAMVLATAALWIAWRLSASYLSPEKRVAGIMLLTLVPFYNFHALKFNANTVLIPFWAATTWWFLRSFETRRAGWAALAGIGAAASMLGKYWSVFLLGGLAIAALSDRRRGAYFRSVAPWLTGGVAALLFAPHAAWVAMHDFEPVRYALETHGGSPPTAAKAASFFVGILAYIAVPIVITLIATRPAPAALRDMLWPAEPDRRIVVVAFAAPFLLAAFVAVLLHLQIVSLWAMSGMTLLPIVLLSSPLMTFSRAAAIRLLAFAIAFPLVMAAASPGVALVIHRVGLEHYATHYRLVAAALADAWRGRTPAPLRIVGSATDIVNGIVFYLPGPPATMNIVRPAQTPWVDAELIERNGIAIVCPEPQTICLTALERYAARYPAAAAESVTIARRYFGTFDRPVRYRMLIIPPPADSGAAPR